MAQPDYQRPLCILYDPGTRSWTGKFLSLTWSTHRHLYLLSIDILTRKCHLCWHRHSVFGENLPRPLRRAIFNNVRQAAKDVDASEEAFADLFERIENFFKRLESYTEVPPTNAMADIIVKIMVEILNIFAIATKEMKQGRASELLPRHS